MAERVRVRELSNQGGNRLLRIVHRSTGSVVTWRRAQMVLLSAQGMDVAQIAQVTFTSPDRVRDVLHNLQPGWVRRPVPTLPQGRPPTFTLAQRRAIKQLTLSRPRTMTCRSPPGAWPSWPTSWSLRGWSTTSATRASGFCSVRPTFRS